MQPLDDLQRLTSSQGALLYRLVDLGYLTQAQVDELINRLAGDRFAKADYSPYPPADLARQATMALSDAAELLTVCRNDPSASSGQGCTIEV